MFKICFLLISLMGCFSLSEASELYINNNVFENGTMKCAKTQSAFKTVPYKSYMNFYDFGILNLVGFNCYIQDHQGNLALVNVAVNANTCSTNIDSNKTNTDIVGYCKGNLNDGVHVGFSRF